MIRRLLLAGAAFTAACATGSRGTPAVADPALTPAPGAPTTAPAAEAPSAHHADVVRYGPSALRYVVHRRLHIQQALGDQTQAQDVGARIFVATAITGPADSIGYPATFLVDSIVADSGTPPPIVDNITKVRKLVFAGRVAPRGEFVNALASDSAVAQSVVQLLGNFRDFLPRLPVGGLKPGSAWTDTVETSQKGSGSEVSRRAITLSTAAGWEDRLGTRSVRVEGSQTYRVAGGGKNAGQPFELSGAGTGSGVAYIAADGRYLGGESQDSTTLTVRLPVQGVAVPVIQVTRTTVAVLP
ncbi:MAG TPA: hypothetical protein VK647_13855 [Gemmatimonadales bacterium]|jgi:hypothetical protein|nr:hypothetical protein [Gemmatimonadales bacterium]